MRFSELFSEFLAWKIPLFIIVAVWLTLFVSLAVKGHRVVLAIVSSALFLFLIIASSVWIYVQVTMSGPISEATRQIISILFQVVRLSYTILLITAFVLACRATDRRRNLAQQIDATRVKVEDPITLPPFTPPPRRR